MYSRATLRRREENNSWTAGKWGGGNEGGYGKKEAVRPSVPVTTHTCTHKIVGSKGPHLLRATLMSDYILKQ